MARVPNLTRSDPLRPACDHPPRPREQHGRRRQRPCFAWHSAPLALQTSGGRTRSRPFRRHGRVPSSVLRDARPSTSGRCPQRASFPLPPPRTSTATCGLAHLASRRNGSWRSSPGWLSFRSGPAPLRPLRGRQRRSRSFTRLCCPRPSTPTQCSETSSPRSCAQREHASWRRQAATASRRRHRRGGSPLTTPPSLSGLPASAQSRSPSPTAAPASPRSVSKTLTKFV